MFPYLTQLIGRRTENRYAAGGIPFGVSWIDHRIDEHGKKILVKKFKRNEQQHNTLKEIFRLVRANHGIDTIAKMLNQNIETYPTPTKMRKGKKVKWGGESIRQMIRSDFLFTGIRKDGLDTDVKLFDEQEVREIRSYLDKRRKCDNPKKRTWNCACSELGKCECGSGIITQGTYYKDKIYKYYLCKDCGARHNADKVDKRLLGKIVDEFENPEKFMWKIRKQFFIPSNKMKDVEVRVRAVKADMKKVQAKWDNAKFLFEEGDYTREEYQEKKKAYQAELASLEMKRKEIASKLNSGDEVIKWAEEFASKELARRVERLALLKNWDEASDEDVARLQKEIAHLHNKPTPTPQEIADLIPSQLRSIMEQIIATGGIARIKEDGTPMVKLDVPAFLAAQPKHTADESIYSGDSLRLTRNG